jgi:hypothetical protein
MPIPTQRPTLPLSYLGVLQARPTPARAGDGVPQPFNPNLRERPIVPESGSAGGGTLARGSLVNIVV